MERKTDKRVPTRWNMGAHSIREANENNALVSYLCVYSFSVSILCIPVRIEEREKGKKEEELQDSFKSQRNLVPSLTMKRGIGELEMRDES